MSKSFILVGRGTKVCFMQIFMYIGQSKLEFHEFVWAKVEKNPWLNYWW